MYFHEALLFLIQLPVAILKCDLKQSYRALHRWWHIFIGQPGSEHYSSFSLRYHVHGMLAECLMNNAHKMENTLGVFQVVMWLVESYKISARRALCPLMVHLETKPLWCQTPSRKFTAVTFSLTVWVTVVSKSVISYTPRL